LSMLNNLQAACAKVAGFARESDNGVDLLGVDDETNLEDMSQVLFRICARGVRLRSLRIIESYEVTGLDSFFPSHALIVGTVCAGSTLTHVCANKKS
jgi:hypothetical protein